MACSDWPAVSGSITMYTNSCCTLYLKSLNYKPTVIPHCFYSDTSIASASKMGLEYQESAECYFKHDDPIVFTKGKDFLIKGVSSIKIDASSEKGISEGIREILEADGKTIMRADYLDYGSKRMHHWELSCK